MKYYAPLLVIALFAGCGEDENSHKTQQQVKKTSQEVVEKASHTKSENTQKLQTHSNQNVEKKTTVTSPTAAIKQEIQKQKEVVAKKAVDPKQLYAKCQGCHGADGKNKALNKSAPIAGWDEAKLVKVLKEYKSQSRNIYGMGSVMQAQAKNLSDEEIEALAKYISKF
jgi:cytochrome c553